MHNWNRRFINDCDCSISFSYFSKIFNLSLEFRQTIQLKNYIDQVSEQESEIKLLRDEVRECEYHLSGLCNCGFVYTKNSKVTESVCI